MTAVGIKELKAHLSDYVDRARTGERIVVTVRGKKVVEMRRLPAEDQLLDKLQAEGKVAWSGRKPRFPERGLRVEGESIAETVLRSRR